MEHLCFWQELDLLSQLVTASKSESLSLAVRVPTASLTGTTTALFSNAVKIQCQFVACQLALCAGDLVNSMFGANQEVSQPLLDLASQDPRFKKGHKRSGKGAGGRGRGRGRRGGAQVGGAGLGFGNTGYAPGTSLAAAAATKGEAGYAPSGLGASFNKGGFESTVDGTNASVASKYQSDEPAEPEPAPPLPPPPSLVPDYPPEAAAPAAATQAPPPTPQPPLPVQSATVANMGFVAQQASKFQQQQAPSVPQPHQQAAAAAAAAAAAPMRQQAPPAQVQGSFSGFKGMYSNRFGTSFVSSGSTGGDQALKATIVAPKQQGQRPAVPAPIPVTERPLFNRPGGLGAAAYQASTHQVWLMPCLFHHTHAKLTSEVSEPLYSFPLSW